MNKNLQIKFIFLVFIAFFIFSSTGYSNEKPSMQIVTSQNSKSNKLYSLDFGKNLEYYEAINFVEGQEVIYLNIAKNKGSFTKSSEYNDGPYPIYYTCPVCECLIRIPKKCTCGRNNIPCVWLNNGWYKLARVDDQTAEVKEKLHSASVNKYAPKRLTLISKSSRNKKKTSKNVISIKRDTEKIETSYKGSKKTKQKSFTKMKNKKNKNMQ